MILTTRVLASLAALCVAARASAQLPGLPVLQGAFAGPGLAVGVNAGAGDRSVLAGIVGWGSPSGRVGLVAGLGLFTSALPGFRGARFAYGARAGVTAKRFASERLAIMPFGGFGSTRATLESTTRARNLPKEATDTGSAIQNDELPLGVAVGWRMRLGASNALGLTAAPSYVLFRRSGAGSDDSRWGLRMATVAELALGGRIGAALGVEFGGAASGTAPGPRRTRVGGGMSIAIGRSTTSR